MTRTGKIARLPADIRSELNSRIHDGLEAGPILQDKMNQRFIQEKIADPKTTPHLKDYLRTLATDTWGAKLTPNPAAPIPASHTPESPAPDSSLSPRKRKPKFGRGKSRREESVRSLPSETYSRRNCKTRPKQPIQPTKTTFPSETAPPAAADAPAPAVPVTANVEPDAIPATAQVLFSVAQTSKSAATQVSKPASFATTTTSEPETILPLPTTPDPTGRDQTKAFLETVLELHEANNLTRPVILQNPANPA